ncbi:hypothetical protein [Micromonospora sp. DPT]|uniref:hypothetical protein n=1 Tax=Micromonospora sp. DPT TaxID=3142975 RepID=UPI003209196D
MIFDGPPAAGSVVRTRVPGVTRSIERVVPSASRMGVPGGEAVGGLAGSGFAFALLLLEELVYFGSGDG